MPLQSGKRKHANELKLQTLPSNGGDASRVGFFQQPTDFITFLCY